MSIGIGVQTRNNVMFVELNGELDHHTSEQVRNKLNHVMETGNIEHAVFNLKRLDFMDSSGIGIILGRYNLLKERGGSVFVIGLNPTISNVFKLSGLTKILNVVEDERQIKIMLEEAI